VVAGAEAMHAPEENGRTVAAVITLK